MPGAIAGLKPCNNAAVVSRHWLEDRVALRRKAMRRL